MTKRTRLLAPLLAAALAFALLLTGCASLFGEAKALSVWVRESDYRPYIEEVFALYQSETGNQLEVDLISEATFDEKLQQAFERGEAPDILLHYNDASLTKLGIEDNFLMLNDQVWVDSLMESARLACDDGNGNLIGLPFWESSVSGCYYNKTLLAEMGLKPATTQREFNELCQAIQDAGRTPLFWGEDCGWMYQLGLDPIFTSNPSLLQQLNDDEITYADIPQVRSMVHWIDDANQKGWLGNPADKGYDDVSKPLASGETVMVDIWDTWFEEDFVPGEYDESDFAVMPIFMGTDPAGTYEGGNLNMMMVNKNATNLDEALGFLEFCAQPRVYNQVFDGVPSSKVFKDQTTIVTSPMVVEASGSIARLERVSTANTMIAGYSQSDMKVAFTALLNGEVTVDGCIAIMDDLRLTAQGKRNALP